MQYTPLKCTCQQDHVSHQYLCRVSEVANVMLNMCRVWHELPTLSHGMLHHRGGERRIMVEFKLPVSAKIPLTCR